MDFRKLQPDINSFKIPCKRCGESFDAEFVTQGDRVVAGQAYCDVCLPLALQEHEGSKPTEPAYLRAWRAITPVEYREYDPEKLPAEAGALRAAAALWVDKQVPRWLLLTGPPGIGKTRIAFHALRKLATRGASQLYVRASQFDRWASSQFQQGSDAASRIQQCHHASHLLLDDLGKGKLTDRAEAELYDLIEHRSAHRLPLILTTNLPVMHLPWCSTDRGAAIVGRILDNSSVPRT